MTPTAIDFEASCLPRHGRSFPIEVAIADERGTRSWLIRPNAAWADWTWTGEAQALHGLTRDTIEREGIDAVAVMRDVAAAIAGRTLVADSILDRRWMATLAAAADVTPPPIDHVGDWLDRFAASDADIVAAQAVLADRGYRRHRAAGDAAWLFAMLDALRIAADGRRGRPAFPWPAPSTTAFAGSQPQKA